MSGRQSNNNNNNRNNNNNNNNNRNNNNNNRNNNNNNRNNNNNNRNNNNNNSNNNNNNNNFTEPIQYDEAGKKINQYIPYFIAKKPWYFESDSNQVDSNSRKRPEVEGPTVLKGDRLEHQRKIVNGEIVPETKNSEPRKGLGITDEFEIIKETQDIDEENHKRKLRNERNFLKSKKNKKVCENCGSSKHVKKDCFERPRKKPFDSRVDEEVDSKSKEIYVKKDTDNWDIKRDLWHGYNADKGFEEQLQKWEEKKKDSEKKELQNKQNGTTNQDLEGLDEDELEEMRELGLLNDNENNSDEKNKSGMKSSLTNEDLKSNLIAPPESKISVRSMDEKPRYLEVLKTGEELKYNPKSRTYKDASEGYFNDRGQFVRYLTGEAQEFEKLKKFAWQLNSDTRAEFLGNKEYGKRNSKNLVDLKNNAEVSPTGLMLAMKEKQKEEEMSRKAKRQELLMKYGIATNRSSDSNGTSEEVEVNNAPPAIIKTDNTYYEYDKTGKIKTKTDVDLEIIENYRKKMES